MELQTRPDCPSIDSKAAIFHSYTVVRLVFKVTVQSWEESNNSRSSLNAANPKVLNEAQQFFPNKLLSDCYKTSVNFLWSKKLILMVLPVFSLLLWDREFTEILIQPFQKSPTIIYS